MSNKLKEYYETYHERMGESGYTGDRHHMTSRFLLFKEWVEKNISKNSKILDVGCGSGTFAKQSPDYEWHGLDFDVSIAAGNPINALVHNIEDFPYPYESGTFDAITCSEVIEHCVNPIEMYKEFRRLLKRDGTLFLSTPNHLWLQNLVTNFDNLVYDHRKPHTIEHIRTFTYDSHKRCLAEAGFVIEEHVGTCAHFCGILNPMAMGILEMLQQKYGVSPTPAELHLAMGKAHPYVQHTIALRCKKA